MYDNAAPTLVRKWLVCMNLAIWLLFAMVYNTPKQLYMGVIVTNSLTGCFVCWLGGSEYNVMVF